MEEVDKRRPGGGGPARETGLDVADTGDCMTDPRGAGLLAPAGNEAELGVVGALDCMSYSTI